MKRALLLACFLFSVPVFAACSPDVVAQYTKDFMSQMEQQSELTADQKKALTAALKNNISDREDILLSYEGQKGLKVKKEIQTQLQSVNANLQAEAEEILTPQQYGIFLKIQGENQAIIRERVKENY
jgi:Spy/CpxP family protein refolding chaperone